MSQGAWKVYSDVFNGKKMYIVGRQIDPTKPHRSDNTKFAQDMEYIEDKQIAEVCAQTLNAIEESNEAVKFFRRFKR